MNINLSVPLLVRVPPLVHLPGSIKSNEQKNHFLRIDINKYKKM